MLETFPCIDGDAAFDGFNPQPFPLSTEHLQAKDVLLEKQGQRSKVSMAADIIWFCAFMIFASAGIIYHPSDKVFGRSIVVSHLDKIIFREFKDDRMKNEETLCNVLVHLSMEWPDLVPMRFDKRMSRTIFIIEKIFMDFVLPLVWR
jgi:hypothetical protein